MGQRALAQKMVSLTESRIPHGTHCEQLERKHGGPGQSSAWRELCSMHAAASRISSTVGPRNGAAAASALGSGGHGSISRSLFLTQQAGGQPGLREAQSTNSSKQQTKVMIIEII